MTCPAYQLALGVAAYLKKQRVPAAVSYGREQFPDFVPDAPRVQFEIDRDVGDTFDAAATAGGGGVVNGIEYTARGLEIVGVLVRISGQSTRAGADEHDHIGDVRELVRAVYCAIVVVATSAKMPITAGRGAFLEPMNGAQFEVGARYELRFGLRGAVQEITGYLAAKPLVPVVTVKAIGAVGSPAEIHSGTGP